MFSVDKQGNTNTAELDVSAEAERIMKRDEAAKAVFVLSIREDGLHMGLEHDQSLSLADFELYLLDAIMALRKSSETKQRIHLPGEGDVFSRPNRL